MDFKKLLERVSLTNDGPDGTDDKKWTTYDFIYVDSLSDFNDLVLDKRMKATDFAIARGCGYEDGYASYWIRPHHSKDKVNYMYRDGSFAPSSPMIRKGCVLRCHLNIDEYIAEMKAGSAIAIYKDVENRHCINLGSYPQRVMGKDQVKLVKKLFARGDYTETGIGVPGGAYAQYSNAGNGRIEAVRVSSANYHSAALLSNGKYCPKSGKDVYLSCEPIEWEVINWDHLPKSINKDGDGTAKNIALRTKQIIETVPFNMAENRIDYSYWQDSELRCFLNGYNYNMEKKSGNGSDDFAVAHPMRASSLSYLGSGFLNMAFGIDTPKYEKDLVLAREEETQGAESSKSAKKTRLQTINPDTTPVIRRVQMTDSEMIKSWIDNGESVLLRGPSGIGKTERIKNLYPNHIYLKLTNNMFPEKVVGSFNFQTGQEIPPSFAKNALLACASAEERKLVSENVQNLYEIADDIYERSKNSEEKVIILLDELLNVKPAIQSLVYTLVLNRLVESGKGLKLPENVVVVATGNQKKYSSVAEDLVAPLEKRFDHILDMEPKVSEWLHEYAIPHDIHPAVVGYIASKYNGNPCSENLKDIGYFYEEPEVGEANLDKNGCVGKTNDPRGWVSVSNSLYNFEKNLKAGKYYGKNVEELLKTTLSTKLRQEWANEFFDFYNLPIPTLEDVLAGEPVDKPSDISEKFAYALALISAKPKDVAKVRNYIRQEVGAEYQAFYDMIWAGNDDKRLMKLAEIDALAELRNSQEEKVND